MKVLKQSVDFTDLRQMWCGGLIVECGQCGRFLRLEEKDWMREGLILSSKDERERVIPLKDQRWRRDVVLKDNRQSFGGWVECCQCTAAIYVALEIHTYRQSKQKV